MDKKQPTNQDRKEKVEASLQKTSNVVVLSVLLAIAISAGAYFLLVKPQLERVGVGKELDIEATTKELEQKKVLHANLKLLEENYNQIDPDDLTTLSTILPSKDSVPELLTQLEVMALNSGLDLTRVSISEVEEQAVSARQRLQQEVDGASAAVTPKGVNELILQIEVNAFSYNSFKTFLRSLETHTRLIDVQTFNFQAENEQQRISAKTYYLSE